MQNSTITTRFAVISIASILAVVAGCSQVFDSGGDGGPSGPTQLEQLVDADAWVMTEESVAELPAHAGIPFTGYTIEVDADGTFDVWVDRGHWERFQYEMIDGTTMELSGVRRAYGEDDVTVEFAFSVAGDSLEGTFSGTSTDGSWDAPYEFERGTLTRPLEYREDFEDGTAGFASSDEWDVIDDGGNKVYAPTSTLDGNADAVVQILAGHDFVLTADVKFVPDETNDETPQLFLGFENSSATQYGGPYSGSRTSIGSRPLPMRQPLSTAITS
jgi:hypothetical protein